MCFALSFTVMRTSLHRRIVAASPSQASVRLLLALGGFASQKPSTGRFLLATTELSRNVNDSAAQEVYSQSYRGILFLFPSVRKQTTLHIFEGVKVAGISFQISTENRIKT